MTEPSSAPGTIICLAERVRAMGQSAFARDTGVLVAGTALAQLVAVGGLPLLSRSYPPAAFGQLAVFTAVASITSTLITLRYETAVMLPSDDGESRTLVSLALRLALWTGVAMTLLALLPWPWPWNSMSGLGAWLAAGAATGIGTAWLAVGNVAFSRQRAYRRLAMVRVGQSVLFFAVALALADMHGGLMLAHGMAVAAMAAALLWGLGRPFAVPPGWTLAGVALAHASAPRYLLPTALLDTFSNQLPVLVIASQWGDAAAGQFGVAWRILALPAALIGAAVAQVFYQNAAADANADFSRLQQRFLKVSLALGVCALPATLAVVLWGDLLFPWVLGDEWEDAGLIAQWLVCSMAMYFVFSPTSAILIVLGHQRLLLASSVIQLGYRLAIAGMTHSPMQYIGWLVVAECVNVVMFVGMVVWSLRVARSRAAGRPSTYRGQA
jgi:O-antigen/teichoic acid export membrane protein